MRTFNSIFCVIPYPRRDKFITFTTSPNTVSRCIVTVYAFLNLDIFYYLIWQRRLDSNQQRPDSKSGELPVVLLLYKLYLLTPCLYIKINSGTLNNIQCHIIAIIRAKSFTPIVAEHHQVYANRIAILSGMAPIVMAIMAGLLILMY